MADTYFISTELVKERSLINDNVDDKLLKRTILNVQSFKLIPLLGSPLYDSIVTEIEAASVSGDNDTLIQDYLYPFLIAWIEHEMPTNLLHKYTNKSVSKNSSNNSVPLSKSQWDALKSEKQSEAEWHGERATNFLCENDTTYPLYVTFTADQTTILPDKDNYFVGINLD